MNDPTRTTLLDPAYSFRRTSAPRVLHLAAIPTINHHLDRFLEIVNRHRGDRDDLSRSLSSWAVSVSRLISDEPDDLVALLAERIDYLRRRILVASDRSPLNFPLVEIESGRVWEAWMLRHAQNSRPYCPYDGHLLGPSTPHPFAEELLTWLRDMLDSPRTEELQALAQAVQNLENAWDRSGWLDKDRTLALDPMEAAICYVNLAKKHSTRRLVQIVNERAAGLAVVEQASRERAEAHLQGIRDTVETSAQVARAAQESDQSVIDALRERVRLTTQDNGRLQERVDRVETEVDEVKSELSQVKNELAREQGKNEENRRALNNPPRRRSNCSIM